MEQIDIQQSIDLLKSSSYKTRQDGLQSLRAQFREPANRAGLERLDRASYDSILDAIFACTQTEGLTYAKATGSVLRNSASSRLTACAATLRTVVEAGVRTIRIRTVELIIDNIILTIRNAEHDPVHPLLADYGKVLRTLLDWPPHVEHLHPRGQVPGKWQDALDFCAENLQLHLETISTSMSSVTAGAAISLNLTFSSSRLAKSFESQAQNRSQASSSPYLDFISCIRRLVEATNAPILASTINLVLQTLLSFLGSSTNFGRGHLDALIAVRVIIGRLHNLDVEVLKQTTRVFLPLISHLWSNKRTSLREEILVIMVELHPYLKSILESRDEHEMFQVAGSVFDDLFADYVKQPSKDLIELNDLRFVSVVARKAAITQAHQEGLQLTTRKEDAFALTHVLSSLLAVLGQASRGSPQYISLNDHHTDTSAKRRRGTEYLEEICRKLTSPSTQEKFCALQLLTFSASQEQMDRVTLENLLPRMSILLGDSSTRVSSWTMLFLSLCARHTAATATSLRDIWLSLWHAASRFMTNVALARAASELLHTFLSIRLVPFDVILALMDSFLSTEEASKPATVSDASLQLWTSLARLSLQERLGNIALVSTCFLDWLCAKWVPSNFFKQAYVQADVQTCDSQHFLQALAVMLDFEAPEITRNEFPIFGRFMSTLNTMGRHEALTTFLLSAELSRSTTTSSNENHSLPGSFSVTDLRISEKKVRLVSFCASETEKIVSAWKSHVTERQQAFSSESLCIATTLCLLNSVVESTFDLPLNQTTSLQKSTLELSALIAAYISRRDCEHTKIDEVLSTVAKTLPNLKGLGPLHIEHFRRRGVVPLAVAISSEWQKRRTALSFMRDNEEEGNTHIDEFDSQMSNSQGTSVSLQTCRDVTFSDHESSSSRTSITAYLQLVKTLVETPSRHDEMCSVPASFFEHINTLNKEEFLAARPLIVQLIASELQLRWDDIRLTLERLAIDYLESYTDERNEVVLSFCLECIGGLASAWMSQDNKEENAAYQMYTHISKLVRRPGTVSSTLQIQAATLFTNLNRLEANYGGARDSILYLMLHSTAPVQWHIANRISTLFEQLPFSQHGELFDTVHDHLPREVTEPEGISIRLLALARLGSAWQTLLRRCVYHIFETPATIPQVSRHAAACMSEMASSLNLENAQSLFHLFASQIIFTWCEAEDLKNIQYKAFGYDSLEAFMDDARGEIVAQAVMRTKEDDIVQLSGFLKTSAKELVVASFGKTAAYALGKDLVKTDPPADKTSSCERTLRDIVDKESYTAFISKHLHEILLQAFRCVSDIDRFEISHARKGLKDVLDVVEEIKAISHSASPVPQTLQPSFPARNLPALFERLCRRTAIQPSSLWTVAHYTYVLRGLLASMDPAMGSLYKGSMLRKIRLLIAFAGTIATTGYPLRMCLHAMRPLLVDVHCANTAIGIVQYLYSRGGSNLLSDPGFLTGSAMMTLLSNGQTTDAEKWEEHQVRPDTDGTGLKNFRKWMVDHLATILASHKQNDIRDRGTHLIRSSAQLTLLEGPQSRISATRLLLEVLKENHKSPSLLAGHMQRIILAVIQSSFFCEWPLSQNRASETDEQFYLYAKDVWETTNPSKHNDQFCMWVASGIGRASSISDDTAVFAQQLLSKRRPSVHWAFKNERDKFSTSLRQSYATIISSLYDLLCHEDARAVHCAENTLRRILVASHERQDRCLDSMNAVIPAEVQVALFLTAYPLSKQSIRGAIRLESCADVNRNVNHKDWTQELTLALIQVAKQDSVLNALEDILQERPTLMQSSFPAILHIVLALDQQEGGNVKAAMSKLCQTWLAVVGGNASKIVRTLLDGLLYLRKQPILNEKTRQDREKWIDVDHTLVAKAAVGCGMPTTALLYAETTTPTTTRSRRSIGRASEVVPADLLLSIYRDISEPDSFYGVPNGDGLESVLSKFDYEHNGLKSLLLRGAKLDSHVKLGLDIKENDIHGLTASLMDLNLNSITSLLLNNSKISHADASSQEASVRTAQKLCQWDIKAPSVPVSGSDIVFNALQSLTNASDHSQIERCLATGYLDGLRLAKRPGTSLASMQGALQSITILSEFDEILSSQSSSVLQATMKRLEQRHAAHGGGHLSDVRPLLSAREDILNVLYRSKPLQALLNVSQTDVKGIEVHALLETGRICQAYDDQKEDLARVAYLQDLVPQCREHGFGIEAVAEFEAARVLGDRDEFQSAIRILQKLAEYKSISEQSFSPGRAKVLAALARRVADARLEKPQEILTRYLLPAVAELENQEGGGDVYHTFAVFCDRQLQDADSREEFIRTQRTRQQRQEEVEAYQVLGRQVTSKSEKSKLLRAYNRSRSWYRLEDDEYKRLHAERETFLKMSMQNYLLSLSVSNHHNDNVLRVVALWLEYAESSLVNTEVEKYLPQVASWKLAVLMNQLCSRLQSESNMFQSLLADLVFRICKDHPYHGLYQLYSNTTKPAIKDDAATSRQSAALHLAQRLKADKQAFLHWSAISAAHEIYERVALLKSQDQMKAEDEHNISSIPLMLEMSKKVPKLRLPPATATVELRTDCSYDKVPTITRFSTKVKIAGGLSAPKIISVIATDGKRYYQLLKGGSDDLRQDAIMEQVFELVSGLLKKRPKTRERQLRIRTYKVVPLSANSGIIEFVSNTMPLQDVTIPMHEKYHPTDLKHNSARKRIADAAQDNTQVRIKAYKEVCMRFSPAMRFWFLEKFADPDEWFERRLAYTRSMASNSMLGYIVGLGDRHLHNILVDSVSGEVVHIDLGIAFEAGRVLGVPEIVPFRLTRDVVDGMGCNKVEGVFRRCCEFTMDALRAESVSIMTLLNVLRYDPLCTWTVSPLKARKMQNADREDDEDAALDEIVEHASKSKDDDFGEAEKALSVVEKKLSSKLSAIATVNELIQQAMDERNLALMFSGWSAYV